MVEKPVSGLKGNRLPIATEGEQEMWKYRTGGKGESQARFRHRYDKKGLPWLAILSVLLAGGCAPVRPTVQVFESLNGSADKPIFVTAARQKDGVKSALRRAGFQVVDRIEDSLWLIRVTIGADQDSKGCGTLNNVNFQLHSEGRSIAEANAKGWTGFCQPNVFDEVSQEMWRQLFEEPIK